MTLLIAILASGPWRKDLIQIAAGLDLVLALTFTLLRGGSQCVYF